MSKSKESGFFYKLAIIYYLFASFSLLICNPSFAAEKISPQYRQNLQLCEGLKKELSFEEKKKLEKAIQEQISREKKIKSPPVKVEGVFSSGDWSFVKFSFLPMSEIESLFYYKNIFENDYAFSVEGTFWPEDDKFLTDLIYKKAPTMPENLVKCFKSLTIIPVLGR